MSGYNPQANGKLEKLNGTLKHFIKKLINNCCSTWQDQLSPAPLGYKNAVNVATGHTPYFLHHGHRATS